MHPTRESIKKEVFNIIRITKNDAFFMREIGYSEYVKKSFSRCATYYLVENKNVLNEYQKYRASLVEKH